MKFKVLHLCIIGSLLFPAGLEADDKEDVKFEKYLFSDQKGLRLFGDYYFSAWDGELSALFSGDKEVIPPGCMLVALKENYMVGKFQSPDFNIKDDSGAVVNGAVFFTIDKLGELVFYLPGEKDDRFLGGIIKGGVVFSPAAKQVEGR